MSPVAVRGLEIEASEKRVLGVAGIIFSRLAQPNPSSQMIFPSLATATASPATPWSFIRRWAASRTGCQRSGAAGCCAEPTWTRPASSRPARARMGSALRPNPLAWRKRHAGRGSVGDVAGTRVFTAAKVRPGSRVVNARRQYVPGESAERPSRPSQPPHERDPDLPGLDRMKVDVAHPGRRLAGQPGRVEVLNLIGLRVQQIQDGALDPDPRRQAELRGTDMALGCGGRGAMR